MKKRVLSLMLCLCMITAILAGCECRHIWKNATCGVPISCALCGEINGEPLSHTWKPASCEAPKTCADCGQTEGEALEHAFGEWAETSAETEEHTCSTCNFTERQKIDRETTMLRHLEGVWMVGDAVVGGDIGSIKDLPADFEGSGFRFESDGNGQLMLMGESVNGIAKFYSYEKDGTDDYIFEFHTEDGYVDCMLCYDVAGDTILLLSIDAENALVFYKI